MTNSTGYYNNQQHHYIAYFVDHVTATIFDAVTKSLCTGDIVTLIHWRVSRIWLTQFIKRAIFLLSSSFIQCPLVLKCEPIIKAFASVYWCTLSSVTPDPTSTGICFTALHTSATQHRLLLLLLLLLCDLLSLL